VYCATKFGVRALTEGLRQEVKPYNIRTTIISPGAMKTELQNSISDAEVQAGSRAFVEKFGIEPTSFARMVAFAMSEPEDVDVNEILFRPTSQPM
jgi:NADP-dependent 3-hydroxy acid dehydrogenase YdfG